jgi:hypothetical protein
MRLPLRLLPLSLATIAMPAVAALSTGAAAPDGR